MQNYQQFNRLLRPHGHEVARLEMRDRGSWFLTTRGGIEMLLGRDDVLDKMQRFLTIDRLMLAERRDRKSTRLNSSHVKNSYAVFCLKKKTRRISDSMLVAS